MAYITDKTKFRHNMWGEGIFKGYGDGNILLVEFQGVGIKKFLASSVNSGMLQLVVPVDETPIQQKESTVVQHSDVLRQYDAADVVYGEKNILEAFESDDVVVFNESYTVIGKKTRARKISATYDLYIIGDLEVEEISVNGHLTVLGSITAKRINCANNLMCQGNINTDSIYVGVDVIANSIRCTEFICDGNAVVKTTIDINESARTEKTLVACEGIIGAGKFSALNAIANEYIEFDGELEGRIVELETDSTLSEMCVPVAPETVSDLSTLPFDEAVNIFIERLNAEYTHFGELDEDALLSLTQMLSSSDLREINSISALFERLTQISYLDEIRNLGDYLVLVYAKKHLPPQLYQYETIEHVDTLLLPKAQDMIDELEFIPESIEKIAEALYIIVQLKGYWPVSNEVLFDKVFSSIGIRYSTVNSVISRSKTSSQKSDDIISDVMETEVADMPEGEGVRVLPKEAVQSRESFLQKPLSEVAKFFSITRDEVERLASAKIRTVGDFISVDEAFIRDLYKKRLFLAPHLVSAHKKLKAAVNELS